MSGTTISIGAQHFDKIRQNHFFYIDKTDFISQWWRAGADVTLITRPRRFGKTLLMSTIACFFSCARNDQETLFNGLKIWEDKDLRALAGSRPVISLSWSGIKRKTYRDSLELIFNRLFKLYESFRWLADSPRLSDAARDHFRQFSQSQLTEATAPHAISDLADALFRHYGVKPIILLDEYDTPLLQAWLEGYWEDMVDFMKALMDDTFKSNASIEKGLITGITRICKESIFSDLNTPLVITTTSEAFETSFGFTESEVFQAMDERGLSDRTAVRKWYDGFTFGKVANIYNPWSVTNYLFWQKFEKYWANTSDNALIAQQIQRGSRTLKLDFESLLQGEPIRTPLREEVTFKNLPNDRTAVWSLLLATGYLRTSKKEPDGTYELALTNYEVRSALEQLVKDWFMPDNDAYAAFLAALITGDLDAMNTEMSSLSAELFSTFDTGGKTAEKFYHGFVLGLLVSLKDRFTLRSNRESGFGRYDVMLVPNQPQKDRAYILEFKQTSSPTKAALERAVDEALQQIEEKDYAQDLIAQGIPPHRILKLGLAFSGKKVLIGTVHQQGPQAC